MTDREGPVRVPQGSQPRFGGVRVGVMIVGPTRAGGRKARLLIRSDTDTKRVDLAPGDTEDLFGVGTLTLEEVHLPEGQDVRGGVTLDFRANDAASA